MKKRFFTLMIAATGVMLLASCDKLKEEIESLRDDVSSGSVAVPESLLAYYTFDEETANDATDNEYDGTFNNSPSFVAETPNGKGKALQLLSSKNQKFIIPYKLLGESDADVTVAFWLKDFGSGQIFVEQHSNNYSGRGFYTVDENCGTSTGQRYYRFDYSPKSLMNSGWHHFVLMYNYSSSNRAFELYVDGSKVDEVGAGGWINGGAGKIVFGSSNGDVPLTSYKIDNVRFYNRLLDSDEVEEIYRREQK